MSVSSTQMPVLVDAPQAGPETCAAPSEELPIPQDFARPETISPAQGAEADAATHQSVPTRSPFVSLRLRLVIVVLLAIMPALVLLSLTGLPWFGFAVGLLALGAAWFGGEKFVLRQVKVLCVTTNRLAQC